MMHWRHIALLAAIAGHISLHDAAAQDVTVIRGATVIDGTGAAPTPNVTIVIRGDRIDSIGPDVTPPPGATIVEAAGKFIVPGLWDKHFHYKDWFPELVISNGVTSAWVQAGGPWINAQKEGIAKGRILGPRMFLRQDQLDVWGTEEEARKRARATIEKGADFIKVYTGATADSIRAIADEAHKAGKIVEGHIGIGARAAVQAGLDGLTHCTGIAQDTVTPDALAKVPGMRIPDTGRQRVIFPKIERWDDSKVGGPNPDISEYWLFLEDPRHLMLFGMMDRAMGQDLVKLLIAENVFIESCLGYIFRNVHDRAEEYRREDHLLLSNPDLAYVPELIKFNVLDYSVVEGATPDEIELMKKGYRNLQWFVKTFVDSGGKMVVGPDTTSNNHATMLPGVATRRELELLVDAGLTPMQAIQAATKWPAEILGKTELGTLAKGKLADLLVLRTDPLKDITAFKQIDLVMQGGRVLPIGYHYDFRNPIPWPYGNEIEFPGHGPFSNIPQIVTGISPDTVVEGSTDVELTVRGRAFVSTSTVQVGGRMLRTRLVSPTELKAVIPADLVKSTGTHAVKVVHRLPGWGETNTMYLVVKFR